MPDFKIPQTGGRTALSSARRRWLLLGCVGAGALLLALARCRRTSPPSAAAAAVAPATAVAARNENPQATAASAPAGSIGAVAEERAAADAARQLRDPRQRSLEFGRALQAWLARDPEGALAYVRQLRAGPDFTQGLLMTLEVIGRRDPDRAIALAGELARTREERACYSSLFAALVASDVPGALQRVPLVPAGEGRANAIRAVMDAWAPVDRSAALAWAQQLSAPEERAAAIESLVADVTAGDPLKAIELAQKHLSGPALERTLLSALHALGETDPAGAAAIVRLLPAGTTQTLATAEAARSLAARSPAEALAWSGTLPGDDLQRIALANILEAWVRTDASAARHYVMQLPPGAAQDAAASHLGRLLAHSEPPAAIAWAQALGSESAREAALVSIASAWAQRDPTAAAQWASTLPAAVQPEALQGALSYWMLQDARAVRDFTGRLSGDTQIHAAAAVAPGLAQAEPAATLAWAQTLASPEARTAAVSGAFGRWLGNDPAAARAWLAAADLPAEEKARLLPPGRR